MGDEVFRARVHGAEFKAQLLAECQQTGASWRKRVNHSFGTPRTKTSLSQRSMSAGRVVCIGASYRNSGITYLPSNSIDCMTLSWGMLNGFTRHNSRSHPTAS